MDSQNHIALLVPGDVCWVSGGMVEEPYYIIVTFICGLGLGPGEVSQGNQYVGIHHQGIKYKVSHNFSYDGDNFRWYRRRFILRFWMLRGCAIYGPVTLVGFVLGLLRVWLLELVEVSVDILGNVNVHCSV